MAHDYDVQYRFVVWSLSHVIDVLGWRQQGVLRQHNLDSMHLALLLRAGRHGKVSFDDARRDTGLPIYAISRAARRLTDRGLGTVHDNMGDRRRRRFHISKKGRDLLESIEMMTAHAVLQGIGGVMRDHAERFRLQDRYLNASERYYEFAHTLWGVTRFLPEAGCGNDEYYFPTDIPATAFTDLFEDPFRAMTEPLWARRETPAKPDRPKAE